MSRPLNPLNKFARTILVEDVSATTAATIPVVSGTLTGFIATSNSPLAGAADPTLTTTGTHIGVSVPDATHPYPLGTWLITFSGTTLTVALLDSLFTNASPYFIVSYPGIDRVYEKLSYVRSRKADTA